MAKTAAMDIRLATGLRSHRKMNRLRRRLGGGACWALMCLWMYAGEAHWDGNLSGLTDEDIEDEAGWDGEAGALVAALVDLRLLVGSPGKRRIHDWAEHQPFAAHRGLRVEAARKAAQARWAKDPDGVEPEQDDLLNGCGSHAGRMPSACGSDDSAMPPTQPNHSSTTDSPSDPSRARTHEAVALEGAFEGHAEPRPTARNPAAPLAIALNRAGFRCTPLNPELVEYSRDARASVEHLVMIAGWPECQGKPASYVIAIARRELAEQAAAVPTTTTNERKAPGKQAQAVMALEGLKRAPR